MFSRVQAIQLGLNARTIDRSVIAGRLIRLYPGVYAMPGAPKSWRGEYLAACFAWGVGAVISHHPAAALYALPGFKPTQPVLWVPRDRHRSLPHRVHRTKRLDAVDVSTLDAIPVTAPERTFIDIASVVRRDQLEEALDDALRRRLVRIARLRWRLKEVGGKGRAGSVVLRELIFAREGTASVPESVLETRLLRVLRAAGLPAPELQYDLKVGGRLIGRVDFAYPDARVAIEADGVRSHSGARAFEHDRARRNRLTRIGWLVIHVTWAELRDHPDCVAETVHMTLAPRRDLRLREARPYK